MSVRYSYQCYTTGDHALTFSFGDTIDIAVNEYILQLFHQYQRLRHPGIKDCIPAYTTITFVYDAMYFLSRKLDPIDTIQLLLAESLIPNMLTQKQTPERVIRIPVCYEADCAPDLASLAAIKGITAGELIQFHSSITYRVFMNGFLPGFAYMGKVHEKINAPRLSSPRQKVPAGSVGIAGDQTGIYPMESPGGWQLIGQTPVSLFDTNAIQPCLLEPGDQVQFYPISWHAFQNWSVQ
ncbi:MAG: 5-oxoprolinase subunit PxpB [Chitinophagaceae bacterium]|nr:5-oxoprolinase subunit PxpB [Chitinophagaceae bacterium]